MAWFDKDGMFCRGWHGLTRMACCVEDGSVYGLDFGCVSLNGLVSVVSGSSWGRGDGFGLHILLVLDD